VANKLHRTTGQSKGQAISPSALFDDRIINLISLNAKLIGF
jgi:hypothetical protein